ncbi:MAG: hypothetical protein O3B04_02820 [Chloroflexi bacterium]|nr:hypothetical protein [Chloroflexota bacterium]
MRFFRSKKVATDVGIVAAVGLFFVAGIFFESKRAGGRVPQVISDVGAVSVPTPDASSEPDSPRSMDGVSPAAVADGAASGALEPTPRPALPGTPDPEAVGKQVFLEISGIENESVIDASTVTIVGATTPDALLSVNGQAVTVELDGSFTIDLELEPGPNFIEFVSSNLRGQETSRVFSVVSIQ